MCSYITTIQKRHEAVREHPEEGVLGLQDQAFVVGGYRGGFCEELLEVSSMSRRASPWELQR